MSTSLKVVSIAHVFWASFRRWAMRCRIRFIFSWKEKWNKCWQPDYNLTPQAVTTQHARDGWQAPQLCFEMGLTTKSWLAGNSLWRPGWLETLLPLPPKYWSTGINGICHNARPNRYCLNYRLPFSWTALNQEHRNRDQRIHSDEPEIWPRTEAQEIVWFKNQNQFIKGRLWCRPASLRVITERATSVDKGLRENSYLGNGNSKNNKLLRLWYF